VNSAILALERARKAGPMSTESVHSLWSGRPPPPSGDDGYGTATREVEGRPQMQ
jgi:hypothetical protein